ncbi:hypothetical protein K144316041_p20850 (plasmid) [Clostridium tetani]|uniref:hypothetical protein n=1 Tax=Clostridium tetani TaxID=1513 RepID=UPI0029553043|nr:hypothetical protein [Clostridium tetani]BDR74246.1 hypothetical protein K144316041_p20850 [Clostridium tetani]
MIKILLFIIGTILTVLIVVFLIDYLTHISLCKDQDLPYGYGTFKDFIREFNKYNNWTVKSYEGSFFSGQEKNIDEWPRYRIHNSIIMFDGKIMILYPISYFKFKVWGKKKWKQMKGIKKISWRED